MSKARDIADLDFNSPDIDGGNIDGATIGGTTPAAGSFSQVNVDNITIDGNEIDVSSGDLTLDVAGRITLDADTDGDVRLQDGGLLYGQLFQSSNNFYLRSRISDGDIIFNGNDGGNFIDALTLDMSEAGAATFNSNIVTANGKVIVGSTSSVFTNSIISATNSTGPVIGAQSTSAAHYAGGFHNTASGAVDLVAFYTGSGALAGSIETGSSGEFIIESSISNKDLVFKGNDGGTGVNALTLDMSEAGYATFNDGISAKSHLVQTAGEIEFDFNGIGEHFTGGNSPHIFAGQGSSSTYLAGTLNFQSRQTQARDINFITGTTPQVALNLNGSTGAGTFADDVIADAFLPTAAGAYGSNHVGVHSSGVVLNAATGQTGYIMSAGSAAMTFGPTGSAIQLGGLTAANKLDDYEEGTWTPVTGPVSTTATYSHRSGHYTKVGNLVTCTFGLKHSGGVWTSTEATISGLPFVVDSTGAYQEPMFIITTLGLAPTGQGGSGGSGAFIPGEVSFYLPGGGTHGRGRKFNLNVDSVMGGNEVFATTSFIKATIIYHSS